MKSSLKKNDLVLTDMGQTTQSETMPTSKQIDNTSVYIVTVNGVAQKGKFAYNDEMDADVLTDENGIVYFDVSYGDLTASLFVLRLEEKTLVLVAVGVSFGENVTVPASVAVACAHPIPDEYLPKMPFCINVIPNDGDGATYIADKSYAEVKEAEMQKRPIVGTFTRTNGRVYTLIGCGVAAPACYFVAFDVVSSIKLFQLVLSEDDGNPVDVYENTLNVTHPV